MNTLATVNQLFGFESRQTAEFFVGLVDSITSILCVIDSSGRIRFVNEAWNQFASSNDYSGNLNWKQTNYLQLCDNSTKNGDEYADKAASGIRSVLNGENETFKLEYPCHSSVKKRWFQLVASKFIAEGKDYFLLCHNDITERVLAEKEAKDMAHIDSLTQLANRRSFDEYLDREWRRASRNRSRLSAVMIDLDNFKMINDSLGHHIGDECLVELAKILKSFVNRPSDICARFGGEEFIVIWPEIKHAQAVKFCESIRRYIEEISLKPENNTKTINVSASLGLVTLVPTSDKPAFYLIDLADELMYQAKNRGGNRVIDEQK